jgi:cytosine deaminase
VSSLAIDNARIAPGTEPIGVLISDGRIAAIAPGPLEADEHLDAAGGLLLPGFIECHFHPDKALTLPRVGPVTANSLEEAMARGVAIKRAFTQEDVVERACAALELAVAHGITTMRAQVDVDTVVGLTGIEAMVAVRERFAGLLDLQLVAFPQEAILRDPGVEDLLRAALDLGADILGGGPNNERSSDDHEEHLRRLFDIAGAADVDLDVHIDMAEDPSQRALRRLARMTIERRCEGRVTASHCCALAAYPQAEAAEVIELVRRAGIQICVCPMSNLLLADYSDVPRGRGASSPKALLAAGVNVAAGSDNMNDMWFRFGRLDLAEVAMLTCLAAGMRTDAEVRDALDMVTVRAARFAGITDAGVRVGAPGDLVLFSADTIEDVMRGLPGLRRTIKAGRVVGGVDTRAWTVEAQPSSSCGSTSAPVPPAS